MAKNGPLEDYMKLGLQLLRSDDPDSLNEMMKHFVAAYRQEYGENRRPRNAARDLPVPAALLVEELEQVNLVDAPVPDDGAESDENEYIVIGPSDVEAEDEPNGSSSSSAIESGKAASDEIIVISSDSSDVSDAETVISDAETVVSMVSMVSRCFVCKSSSVSQENGLVECFECHRVYHQNCIIPPVRDINLNDPRNVWYCKDCLKKYEPISSVRAEKKNKKVGRPSSTSSSTKQQPTSSKKVGRPPKTSSSTSSKMTASKKKVKKMDKKATKRPYLKKNKKN